MRVNNWYRKEISEIEKELSVSISNGLSNIQADERLRLNGANSFKRGDEETLFDIFLKQFVNPLNIVLIVAGLLTMLLRETSDTIVIFVAVGINLVIGIYQEYSAEEAFDALNKSQTRFATVIRDGQRKVIKAEEVVVGDIVVLDSGHFVPADVRLVNSKNFTVNESALTGEWQEVEKNADKIFENVQINEQKNIAFMGTVITSGEALGIVVATGAQTEIGKIALNLSGKDEDTPFQKSIKKLSRLLVLIIIIILVLVIGIGLARGTGFYQLVLIAVALAVAAIPEGLPISVSVVLVFGMKKILKMGGLVRNLLAAETLGSTTVILTDKTGTLTEANMEVEKLVTLDHLMGKDSSIAQDNLLRTAILSSDAYIDEGKVNGGNMEESLDAVVGRPVEKAIIREGIRNKLYQKYLNRYYPEIDNISFTSELRFGGSLNKQPKGLNVLNITGAPEAILEKCTNVLQGNKKLKLTEEKRKILEDHIRKCAGEGKRLVAVAFSTTKLISAYTKGGEMNKQLLSGLVLAGLIVLHDPIRAGVFESINLAKKANTRVVMMTGDYIETAKAIATDVGIYHEGDLAFTGAQVEKMSDEELMTALPKTTIFARVLPHQKLRIAQILKKQGEIVAMTGDGINDAPALREANIGIALGSGTEVAKEASDLVLLNNGFEVIVHAIKEGRRILDNLKKVVIYLLSTGFTEIALVVVALIAGSQLPILPVQVLWANLVGEGLMNFAFAFEPAESIVMSRNPKDKNSKEIMTKQVKLMIGIMSGVTSVVVLCLYFYLQHLGLDIDRIRTIMFLAISIGSMLFAFSLKNLHVPLWKIDFRNNPYLLGALGVSFFMLGVALFASPVKNLLSIVTPSAMEIFYILILGLVNLIAIEIVKRVIFKEKEV